MLETEAADQRLVKSASSGPSASNPENRFEWRLSDFCAIFQTMSVEQIKREITLFTDAELNEVSAFLFYLRHRNDPDFQLTVETMSNDHDKENWLTPDEFEHELEKR